MRFVRFGYKLDEHLFSQRLLYIFIQLLTTPKFEMNEEETIHPIVVDAKRQRLIEKFIDSGKWPLELEVDFIEALKKCPALWAKQTESFKNPLLKASQLERLGLEFSGLSEANIVSKIKLLKDNFTRVHKQIAALENSNEDQMVIEDKIKALKSKWHHYERCEFLAEHIKHRNRASKDGTNENSQESTSSGFANMVSWFTSSMSYPERWQGAEDLPFVKFQPTEKMRQQKNSHIKNQRSRLMQRQKEMTECYMDVDSLVKTMEKQEESLLKREQMLKAEREKLSLNPLFNYILGKDHVVKKINPSKIDDLKFELDGVIDRYAREHPK
ncbi:uncharacterized protein LOC124490841 [Dermatophagoides farinae]|uniref:uncharacterized protein LOC124490841 n=1 Tax=Dermatophagoides farinae TaxID=6954 RepID=UPI001F0F6118|nr:uncharacterized protein LOC124490841 [Dermatophagoides farinae]